MTAKFSDLSQRSRTNIFKICVMDSNTASCIIFDVGVYILAQ